MLNLSQLLSDTSKVTPRLLFELYTFNYQRTLFEKLLNDKIDDALRVIERDDFKKTRRNSTLFDLGGLNLDTFIELLNILDEVVSIYIWSIGFWLTKFLVVFNFGIFLCLLVLLILPKNLLTKEIYRVSHVCSRS